MIQGTWDLSIRAGGEYCFELEFTDATCDPRVSSVTINGQQVNTKAISYTYGQTTDGEQSSVIVDNPLAVSYSYDPTTSYGDGLDPTSSQFYSITFAQPENNIL